jgi:integrase
MVAKAKRPGGYADGHGLYLRIGPTGARSWVFRYRKSGRLHDMGLGGLHTISLADARLAALDLRKRRMVGEDPLAAKRQAKARDRVADAKIMTFTACAEAYMADHKKKWKNPVHAAQWPASMRNYVYPVIGKLPVQSVDTGLVMQILQPIWSDKPETATRVRGRIENVIDWATALGYRKGENPARWRGHLDKLLPAKSKIHRVEHHPAMPYREIGAFMAELRQQRSIGARALEFTILTAARTDEVLDAPWDEINFADRIWTIPAERMKAEKEHRVPLSDAAVAILEQMREIRSSDFIFPGRNGPLSNMTMLALLRRMRPGDLTVHGFRSTFRDWAADETNFPAEVAEMALAHAVGDKVEAAYRRGTMFQKRRQLADAWGRYCARPLPSDGEVVALRS